MSTQASTSTQGSQSRKIRLKDRIEELSSLEGNNCSREIKKITEAIEETKSLLEQAGLEQSVSHPGERYLDSRVLFVSSDLAVRYSEAFSGNVNKYDWHELAQHIRSCPEQWEAVFPREVPACGSLFGTFDPTPPEQRPRAVRVQRQRQHDKQLQAPKTIDKTEKQEGAVLTEQLERTRKCIKRAYSVRGAPLSYFHCVLNPHSFSATVHNIYNLAFLAQDNFVKIYVDPEIGLPFISLASKHEMERGESSDENQFIVSMDMHRWKELVKVFDIKEPMLKTKTS